MSESGGSSSAPSSRSQGAPGQWGGHDVISQPYKMLVCLAHAACTSVAAMVSLWVAACTCSIWMPFRAAQVTGSAAMAVIRRSSRTVMVVGAIWVAALLLVSLLVAVVLGLVALLVVVALSVFAVERGWSTLHEEAARLWYLTVHLLGWHNCSLFEYPDDYLLHSDPDQAGVASGPQAAAAWQAYEEQALADPHTTPPSTPPARVGPRLQGVCALEPMGEVVGGQEILGPLLGSESDTNRGVCGTQLCASLPQPQLLLGLPGTAWSILLPHLVSGGSGGSRQASSNSSNTGGASSSAAASLMQVCRTTRAAVLQHCTTLTYKLGEGNARNRDLLDTLARDEGLCLQLNVEGTVAIATLAYAQREVRKWTAVLDLSVKVCTGTNEVFVRPAVLMSRCPRLRSLRLGPGVKTLTDVTPSEAAACPLLKHLSLGGWGDQAPGTRALLPQLTTFSLYRPMMNSTMWRSSPLCTHLAAATQLRELSLASEELGADEVAALMTHLPHLRHVTLGAVMAPKHGQALPATCSWHSLWLTGCVYGPALAALPLGCLQKLQLAAVGFHVAAAAQPTMQQQVDMVVAALGKPKEVCWCRHNLQPAALAEVFLGTHTNTEGDVVAAIPTLAPLLPLLRQQPLYLYLKSSSASGAALRAVQGCGGGLVRMVQHIKLNFLTMSPQLWPALLALPNLKTARVVSYQFEAGAIAMFLQHAPSTLSLDLCPCGSSARAAAAEVPALLAAYGEPARASWQVLNSDI